MSHFYFTHQFCEWLNSDIDCYINIYGWYCISRCFEPPIGIIGLNSFAGLRAGSVLAEPVFVKGCGICMHSEVQAFDVGAWNVDGVCKQCNIP